MTCSPDPPDIPTHSEYSLPSDDGKVVIQTLEYPTHPTYNRMEYHLNSSWSSDLIPKNYMTNLSYWCGSAREFVSPDGSHSPSQELSCQWDRRWSGSTLLPPCDWVACLQPPLPPPNTHLRSTGWFGLPLAFGQQVSYVCEKGRQFEEDPSQKEVRYTCQDGTQSGLESLRGFFDVPENDEDWPNCVLGENKNYFLIQKYFLPSSAVPGAA